MLTPERTRIKTVYTNMYTFQTELNKFKQRMKSYLGPRFTSAVNEFLSMTSDETNAYIQHKEKRTMVKAKRLGIPAGVASRDHDAWDVDVGNGTDARVLVLLLNSSATTDIFDLYETLLVASGRRGEDLFRATFMPDPDGRPTWAYVRDQCKDRVKDGYSFPLLCSNEHFQAQLRRFRLLARHSIFHDAQSMQKYANASLRQTNRYTTMAAGRPVTVHRLRKLYAALLVRCYNSAPLGADEFVRRAFNHRPLNTPTSTYFPPCVATIRIPLGTGTSADTTATPADMPPVPPSSSPDRTAAPTMELLLGRPIVQVPVPSVPQAAERLFH